MDLYYQQIFLGILIMQNHGPGREAMVECIEADALFPLCGLWSGALAGVPTIGFNLLFSCHDADSKVRGQKESRDHDLFQPLATDH